MRVPRVDPLAVIVVLVAVAARFGSLVLGRGGVRGNLGYDQGVYYAAADALIHGRMPYADFVLLHPPALMLALTPFAALGDATTDHTGFVAANLAFEVLGGLNAALVMLIARRAGLGRGAALVGALVYALWPGAVVAETGLRLEPLGNFFLLDGLYLLVRGRTDGWRPQRLAACGALLALAATTKIWWIVAVIIVGGLLAWQVRRAAGWFVAGAVGAVLLVAGPFFVFAPGEMWRMVVTDQLGRARIRGRIGVRLSELASLHLTLAPALAVVVTLLVAALLVVRTWRFPALRPVLVIGVVQFVVLLASPSSFAYYDDFLAPALGIAAAAAVARRPSAESPRAPVISAARSAALAVVLALIAVAFGRALVLAAPHTSQPFPGKRLAAMVRAAHVRCVMSDSPTALIELDVLSRGLAHGCPNRVDVSGSALDRDRLPDGRHIELVRNARWQRDVYRYLRSGNAEIVIRRISAISPANRRRLDRLPVIAQARRQVVHRTP